MQLTLVRLLLQNNHFACRGESVGSLGGRTDSRGVRLDINDNGGAVVDVRGRPVAL